MRKPLYVLIIVCVLTQFGFAGPPLGYFTEVQPVPGIDEGSWRDSVGSVSAAQLEIFFRSDYPTLPVPNPRDSSLNELYVAKRDSPNDPFGPRELLDITSEEFSDFDPMISHDGLRLTFDSSRPGSPPGTTPSWISTRDSVGADWSEPILTTKHYPFEAGEEFNIDLPTILVDESYMVFGKINEDDPTRALDLYSASRSSVTEPFSHVMRLDGISRPGLQDRRPSLSFDGRMLFFQRAQLDHNSPQIFVSHRESLDGSFEDAVNIDRFSMGPNSRMRHEDAERIAFDGANFGPFISPDWPADESKLFFTTTCCAANFNIYEATWRQATPLLGDMTSDGIIDAQDIAIVTKAVKFSVNAAGFDLNSDGVIDETDRNHWIQSLAKTWYGDANLDGEFNSADLVAVFQAGEYEDGNMMNSTWATGDWNGDGEFDSSDFVKAFQGGGFEQGRRQALAVVPEPSNFWPLILFHLAYFQVRTTSRLPDINNDVVLQAL